MNRTPQELIDAIAFALENDAIDGILVGDNEFARLVLDWREKAHIVAQIDTIDGALLDNPPKPPQKLIDLMKPE